MKKYWAFFRASVQNTIAYRGPIVIWLIQNILSLITIVAIWLSASTRGKIGGYTKPELVSYYIVSLFLQWLTGWFPFYGVVDEIKKGGIILSAFIKPISYYWSKFASEVGWHAVSSLIGLGASSLLALLFSNYMVINLFPSKIILLILTTVMAIFVVFSFSLCLGLLAFWFTEVHAVDSLFWATRIILGGQGLPVSFFPGIFQKIIFLLPFRYTFSFPLEIYFGKLSPTQIIQGILMQMFWIVVFVNLYQIMWRSGRRAYTSFGQ